MVKEFVCGSLNEWGNDEFSTEWGNDEFSMSGRSIRNACRI